MPTNNLRHQTSRTAGCKVECEKKSKIVKKRTLSVITYLIAGLTSVSCILSISHNNIYQDGEWANAQWLGQDIVTILIALPFLLISFIKGIENYDNR
jgi:hypothetical protein